MRRSIAGGTNVSPLLPQFVAVPLHEHAAGQLEQVSAAEGLPPEQLPYGSTVHLLSQPSPPSRSPSSHASVPVRRPSPHF